MAAEGHQNPGIFNLLREIRTIQNILKMKHMNALQVMFSMGEEVSEEKAGEKIREADLDGDGRVNH